MQVIVGVWVPVWNYYETWRSSRVDESRKPSDGSRDMNGSSGGKNEPHPGPACLAGLLFGSAMVARGEIGLYILEIGYNETPYVSQEGYIVAVWAIILSTIIGPVTVGYLIKAYGQRIGMGEWGLQGEALEEAKESEESEENV